jgi:pimeloyl-ACP methyl ester carboxylesterase
MSLMIKVLATLVLLNIANFAHATIPATEREVLINLYNSTNGDVWINNTGWKDEVGTECTWYGVFCNAMESHVLSIDLSNNNLVGPLPSLDGLATLEYLGLFNNNLTGSIPSLSGLTNIVNIHIDNNQLTGTIPSLSGLTNLSSFFVSSNQLTGPIPPLSGLTALTSFWAVRNQLTGTIPSLNGLTNLSSFLVSFNQLTGPIPPLSELTALTSFWADGNQLTGTIPSLNGLTNLVQFLARNNQLTGSLPSLSGLSALQYFMVSANQLTGTIPSLSGLTNLQSYEVSINQLTGSIPSLSGLSALKVFSVNNNQLNGPVPAPPNSLIDGGSQLCGNSLVSSGDPTIDAAWVFATGGDWLACQNPIEAGQKVVLLLHGMNTTPYSAWNDFSQQYFNNYCGLIYDGVIAQPQAGVITDAIPNAYGTKCYALTFGRYDKNGDDGLENAKLYAKQTGMPLAGDFSTFEQLGDEVRKAVSAIRSKNLDASIVLLGHSRGGLAARAFLQNPTLSDVEKNSVVGLITMGTPHSGSPLGRIYSYLAEHTRPIHPQFRRKGQLYWTIEQQRLLSDWGVVDFLRGADTCAGVTASPRLDVRRPTIDYLSTDSPSIDALNNSIANLPTAIRYGAIVFEGNNIGYLARARKLGLEYKYSVFDQSGNLDSCILSTETQSSVLNGKNPDDSDYYGDGIVPTESQQYGDATVRLVSFDRLHTEETNALVNGDIYYVEDMFCKLGLSDWIARCQ